VNEARFKIGLVLIGAAAAWSVPILMFVPGDFVGFLGPWYRHMLTAGPVAAFAHPFGNYAPPYLYLLAALTLFNGIVSQIIAIKLLSTAGAAWLAFAIFRLLKSSGANDPVEAAAWSLVLPTVVLNVPLLAQADAFWVAPCVLAVAASVRGNAIQTALWASVGFAFKAQAVFLAPFVALVLIRCHARWWAWLVPVAVYLFAITPAWAAGWPLRDLLTIYLRQAQWHPPGDSFISTAPNLWLLVKLYAPFLYSAAAGIAAAGVAALVYIVWLRRATLGTQSLVAAAALSGAIIPFLLPGMHERFFALSEILTFCLAWMSRRWLVIAAAAQAAFLLNAGGMLGGPPLMLLLGVAAETAVILLLVRTACRSAETSQTVEAGIASRDLDSKIAAESDLCGRKTRVGCVTDRVETGRIAG